MKFIRLHSAMDGSTATRVNIQQIIWYRANPSGGSTVALNDREWSTGLGIASKSEASERPKRMVCKETPEQIDDLIERLTDGKAIS